jgi:predicted O-methyltransferase YrrM
MLTAEQIHPLDLKHAYNPAIFNWADEYKSKYTVALNLQPKTIVEIGVRAGYSAYSFLSACPKAKYYGYDVWDGVYSKLPQLWAKDWAEKILKPFDATLIVKNTQETGVLEEVADLEVDLAYVDGDHTYYGALHDLKLVNDCVKAKFILIDDTVFIPKVKEAVETFIQFHGQYEKMLEIDSPRGAYLLKRKNYQITYNYELGDGTVGREE